MGTSATIIESPDDYIIYRDNRRGEDVRIYRDSEFFDYYKKEKNITIPIIYGGQLVCACWFRWEKSTIDLLNHLLPVIAICKKEKMNPEVFCKIFSAIGVSHFRDYKETFTYGEYKNGIISLGREAALEFLNVNDINTHIVYIDIDKQIVDVSGAFNYFPSYRDFKGFYYFKDWELYDRYEYETAFSRFVELLAHKPFKTFGIPFPNVPFEKLEELIRVLHGAVKPFCFCYKDEFDTQYYELF